MGNVTESIYSDDSIIIPLAEVLFIEKLKDGLVLVLKGTSWDSEVDYWKNNAWVGNDKAQEFLSAWTMYRHELEKDTLMTPEQMHESNEVIPGTLDALDNLGIKEEM